MPWPVGAPEWDGVPPHAPVRPAPGSWERRAGPGTDPARDTRRGRVVALAEQLVAAATSGEGADDGRYAQLRQELLTDPAVGPRIPRYVRMARDLGHFRQWVRDQRATYDGRRELIWTDFGPILDHIARVDGAPRRVDAPRVHELWREALARGAEDPDGAIRAARALLETVCRHVLDGCRVPYAADARLPRLYQLAAGQLLGAPGSSEADPSGDQPAGGCHAVVDALGTARRWPNDSAARGMAHAGAAHGGAAWRNAELAVNLAGSVALYLVAAFEARGGSA